MSLWGITTFDGYTGVAYQHLPMSFTEVQILVEETQDPMAFCNAGWCVFNGIGHGKDEKKAIDYWKKAAEKSGNAGSCYNLGYCYMFGLSVKQDDQIASDWFAKYYRGRNAERLAYNVNKASLET